MLRAIALSDLHGNKEAVKAFLKDVKNRKLNVEHLIIAGDIGTPEDPNRLRDILEILRREGFKIYYVTGNWDISSTTPNEPGIYNMDDTGPITIDGFQIVGHGEKFSPYKLKENMPTILVTHYPPYGILDRGFKYTLHRKGSHTGLIKLNYLIEEYKPFIHIFGHAHKSGGLTLKLNGVYYVNTARLDRFTRDGKCIGNYTLIIADRSSPPKIKHFYIGGVLKICSRCGRKVLMPPSWNVCKDCMLKDELTVIRLPKIENPKIRITIYRHKSTSTIKEITHEIKVPFSTIRTKNVLREFVEDSIREEIYNRLLEEYEEVLIVPKESLTYLYPCPLQKKQASPFIVRLFQCKSCTKYDEKNPSCLIFKTFLWHKAEIAWALKSHENNKYEKDSYMMIFIGENRKINTKNIRNLQKNGINVIISILPKGFAREEAVDTYESNPE